MCLVELQDSPGGLRPRVILRVRHNGRAEDLMPAGPSPLGFTYFAAVKFAGFTTAGVWLNRRYG
jgi:hypothetical protein